MYSGYHLEFEKADDRGLCDNDREEYFTFVIKKSTYYEEVGAGTMENYKLSYSRQQRLKNEEQELDKNVAEIDKNNKFNNSVADIRTTKELSLKEIDKFIGKKSLPEVMSDS